jgi:hypothetical protein
VARVYARLKQLEYRSRFNYALYWNAKFFDLQESSFKHYQLKSLGVFVGALRIGLRA